MFLRPSSKLRPRHGFQPQFSVLPPPPVTEDLIQYEPKFYTRKKFRVLAQQILGGQWIHLDIPVRNPELTFQYNQPNLFRGELPQGIKSLNALSPALEPEATYLYAEEDGKIRATYILLPFDDNNASQIRNIEGIGFSVYPKWVDYMGAAYSKVQVDPMEVIRYIWAHCQQYQRGRLGVILNPATKTPVRLGTEPKKVEFETGSGENVAFDAGPYDLNWWEVTNCGSEIEKLMKEGNLEYREKSYWEDGTKQNVIKYLDFRYPGIGVRLTEQQFIEGQNLINVVPGYNESADNNQSDIIFVGAGEGRAAIRGYVTRYNGRIRRTKTIQDEDVKTNARAQTLATEEANKMDRARYSIDNIDVNLAHPNAPMGTFHEGDDVYVSGDVIYRGRVSGYFRITSYVYKPGQMVANLALAPSEFYNYPTAFGIG